MKLKEVDYEINKDIYATNCVLQMLMEQYDERIPKDIIEHIEKASVLADKYLSEDFVPKMDIKDIKLVSRVTFDMDTEKDLKKYIKAI